jgi:hypothetical protein
VAEDGKRPAGISEEAWNRMSDSDRRFFQLNSGGFDQAPDANSSAETVLSTADQPRYGYRRLPDDTAVSDHDPPETPTKAARVLIGWFAGALAFESVHAYAEADSTLAALGYGVAAVVVAIGDYKLKWLLSGSPKLAKSLNHVASDARWWTAVVMVSLLIIAFSPYVEQRRWPFAWMLERPAPVTSTGSDVYDTFTPGSPDAPISWQPQFQLLRTGGGPDVQILGFYFQGIANSAIEMKEAYLISEFTGHKEQLKANIQSKGELPVDQVDIPPGASVELVYDWKTGLSLKDFLDQWGQFRFVANYNGIKYDNLYTEGYVRGLVQNTIPNALGPRMTPKGQ